MTDALGRSDLHRAALDGDLSAASAAIAAGDDVNSHEKRLAWTPLHFAADNGAVEVARALLDAGADVDAPAKDGQTPLSRAVIRHRAAPDGTLIRLLVAAGADPDRADNRGKTPRGVAELVADADPAWLNR